VPEADAEPQSGSRLKGKYLLGEDGSKEYQYRVTEKLGAPQGAVGAVWWDSQRQEDCIFGPAGDGQKRCMPFEGANWAGGYADSQCAIPIAFSSPVPIQCNSKQLKYAIYTYNKVPQCGDTVETHIYELGQQVSLGSSFTVFYMNNGVCEPGGTVSPNGAVYKVGPEVPASAFVGGTPMIDP
jgi:hypothetical protein